MIVGEHRMPMANTKQAGRLSVRYRLMGDKPQRTTYTTVSKKLEQTELEVIWLNYLFSQ